MTNQVKVTGPEKVSVVECRCFEPVARIMTPHQEWAVTIVKDGVVDEVRYYPNPVAARSVGRSLARWTQAEFVDEARS